MSLEVCQKLLTIIIQKRYYSTSQDQSPCLLQYAYNFEPFIYLKVHSAFCSGNNLTLQISLSLTFIKYF